MPRAVLPFPALLLATTFGVACGAQTPPPPTKAAAAEAGVEAALATPPVTAPEDAAAAEATTQSGEAVPEGAPKITADAAVHEFGAIKATDSIKHVFTIRNAGNAELKIERVQRT